MMIFVFGVCLIAFSLSVMFVLDDADPYQRLFPLVWKLLRLIFISGVVATLAGWITVIWRFLA